MSGETYRYQDLTKENYEFRLIQLLPLRSKSPQEPLQCHLEHVSLKRIKFWRSHGLLEKFNVNYEAISYCWGDPTRSRVIVVDGRNLTLPVSSEKALRRMAYADGSRILFLDAVCINQDNLAERTAQVLLMGDIYRHARCTVVYLGDGVDSTAKAVADVRLLHLELHEEARPRGGISNVLMGGPPRPAEHSFRTPIDEGALIELFGNPWFKRLWVVQEVAVASQSFLIGGFEELDLKIVLEVAVWLFKSHLRTISSMLRSAVAAPNNMWEMNYNLSRDGSQSLFNALIYGRVLYSANPRDKVFGMLGLLSPEDTDSKLLDPDYTKSVSDVFRDAVRHCIGHQPYLLLTILNQISHPEGSDLITSGFPSWVPRFDRPLDAQLHTVGLLWPKDAERLRNASLFFIPTNASNNELNVLVLLGIDLCSVQAASATHCASWEIIRREDRDAMLAWYEDVVSLVQSSGLSEPAIARTLVADTDEKSLGFFKEPSLGLAALLQQLRDQMTIPSYEDLDSNASGSTVQASLFLNSMDVICHRRKVALMSNGTIGMVPQLTLPTDMVVMMHGGKMPLVLRPHGEDFLMLGECYVDGWMQWQEHGKELHQMMMDTEPKTYRIR